MVVAIGNAHHGQFGPDLSLTSRSSDLGNMELRIIQNESLVFFPIVHRGCLWLFPMKAVIMKNACKTILCHYYLVVPEGNIEKPERDRKVT